MADIISIARAAMITDQQRLNTVSHNLANISTDGYKRHVFSSSLQQLKNNVTSAAHPSSVDFTQGPLKLTDHFQNIALNGKGFLVAKTSDNEYLTRRGALSVDENGYLALTTGERILGERGLIQLDSSPFEVHPNGDLLQSGRLVDKLKLVDVEDHLSLEYVGRGFYQATQSVEPTTELRVMQGHLEGSNVQSLSEMMELMTTVRHYEAASQVLRSYDQVLDTAINELAEF